jgi:excinuclease ABC subunit A
LHFQDIVLLYNVLNKLIEKGNSVVIIEHNLDVIKMADYIIDIGPDGGKKGGKIVAAGTPEEIIKSKDSLTAKYLAQELK